MGTREFNKGTTEFEQWEQWKFYKGTTEFNQGTTEFDMGTMEIEQGKISNAPFGFYRGQGMILMGACLLLF